MKLEDIFAAISMFFLIIMVFLTFKTPKHTSKLEVILLCLFGFLLYGSLCGACQLNASGLCLVFCFVWIIFLEMIIYSIIGEITFFEKWQAISLSVFGFLAYGFLFAACYKI